MSFSRVIAVLALGTFGLVVIGCQPTADPAQAGFFSGLSNLASGTYDQRVRQKQQQLVETEWMSEQMRQRARQSTEAEQQSGVELDTWQAKVAAMDREVAVLERQLAAAEQRRGTTDREIKEAKLRLRTLDRDRQQIKAGPAPSAAEQKRYERELQAAREAMAIVSRTE